MNILKIFFLLMLTLILIFSCKKSKDEMKLDELESIIKEQTNLMKYTPTILPLQDGKIINKFGSRLDSLTNTTIINNGVDILAQVDTTVRATAKGKVLEIKTTPSNQVIIDHGKGLKTSYSNLSKVQVQLNQDVDRWKIIGTAKKSGNLIHYEVMKNDSCINPVDYILN